MSSKKLRRILKRINWYPPFIGAGIRLKEVDDNLRHVVSEMKLTWYNRNLFGTHFGGSLFAMTDPFYVFMVSHNLGPEFIVWDKSACIKFLRPGRGTVRAVFKLSDEKISEVKKELQNKNKYTFTMKALITDTGDNPVAELEKEIYVRRKKNR